MKAKVAYAGAIVCLAVANAAADPVVEEHTWQHTYPVATNAPHLIVSNIWGDVRVRVGAPGNITVRIEERRMAPTTALFEQSQEAIRLSVDATGEGVSMIVGDPTNRQRNDACRGCRVEYQFDIAVPVGTRVDVRTVTDGRVDVVGVRGLVSAANVNGAVAVSGLSNCAQLETVNGAIDVAFVEAPRDNCRIETINGDITVGLPPEAGLDARVNIAHGEVISELDVAPLPLAPLVSDQRRDGRFAYRIEQSAGLRFGAGGPTFAIESLNGNINFRKNQ